jgi:hypothetical protein
MEIDFGFFLKLFLNYMLEKVGYSLCDLKVGIPFKLNFFWGEEGGYYIAWLNDNRAFLYLNIENYLLLKALNSFIKRCFIVTKRNKR